MSTRRWGERLVRYPDDLTRRYRQAGLWGTRTIAGELHAVAAAHPQRDAVVARARDARAAGAGGFRFTGPADRPSLLTRMDLAERVRTEAGGLIAVDGPAGLRDDLAAGLVSGRADLVSFTGEEAA